MTVQLVKWPLTKVIQAQMISGETENNIGYVITINVTPRCHHNIKSIFFSNIYTCGGEAAKMSSAAPPNMPSSSSSASKRDCIFDELLAFGSVCVYKNQYD